MRRNHCLKFSAPGLNYEVATKHQKDRANSCFVYTLYKLCAFPVRICIPGEDTHSRWSTSPFLVRHIFIPDEAHPHSRWGTSSFLVRMWIPGEAHPYFRWGCAFPVSHIAIPGEDGYSIVIHPHRECISSKGLKVCLTGNAHLHRECISSPRMHIVYTWCR